MDIDHATRVANDKSRVIHVFHVFCNGKTVNSTVFKGPFNDCGVYSIIYKKKYQGAPFDWGDMEFGGIKKFTIDKQKGVELLQHLIKCMLSSPAQLLNKFDVELSDDDYMMKRPRSLDHRLHLPMVHPLTKKKYNFRRISLPRLMFENADQMLSEISYGSRDEGIEVFFYDEEYGPFHHNLGITNSCVIYPIIPENYQRDPNLFFKLFHNNAKDRFIKVEMTKRFKELTDARAPSGSDQPDESVQPYAETRSDVKSHTEPKSDDETKTMNEEITKNWTMTPGQYLRQSIRHMFGIKRNSGGRRRSKKGTRRHSKKKGTRRH